MLRKAGEVDDDEDHRYGTSVGMSCRRNWPSVRAGCGRGGQGGAGGRSPGGGSRLRGKEGIIPGCTD